MHAQAQEALGKLSAPLPARLGDEISAKVDFFTQMAVEGQKRRAAAPLGQERAVVDPDLKLPRLAAAVGVIALSDI